MIGITIRGVATKQGYMQTMNWTESLSAYHCPLLSTLTNYLIISTFVMFYLRAFAMITVSFLGVSFKFFLKKPKCFGRMLLFRYPYNDTTKV
jgi:hypothetical protein